MFQSFYLLLLVLKLHICPLSNHNSGSFEMAVTGFEGYEKRLEVEFFIPSVFVDPEGGGLRSLSRSQVNELLSAAECTIVSQLNNDHFDSYVLSESSLFVYPYKLILKTCGTTKLLKSIPILLEMAASLSLQVCSCKYTRGAYFFPREQQLPQGSFSVEVSYLDQYFGKLGHGSKAYILGDLTKEHRWHIYAASAIEDVMVTEPVYTLEMCMTKLDIESAAKFYKSTCSTAMEMTVSSGIANLLSHSRICDYAFDPCGYSMNGIDGTCLSTIHVTPEEGFSYASFETMGYGSKDVDLLTLVNKVLACFKPAVFSIALHTSGATKGATGSWGSAFCPRGYFCDGSSKENLPGGLIVVFHTFRACSNGHRQVHSSPFIEGTIMQDSGDMQDVEDNLGSLFIKQPTATKFTVVS